ncbi:MAG: bacteriophage abortive infection AbiH family protein [Bacteroidota bacterium]
MSNKRLYIIGNGFDLHHEIKSRYSHFKEYVESTDNNLFDLLEEHFPGELWSDFEQTLAYIDTDTITDGATNYLESYGSDNWSEASHHDYQYEIQRIVDSVTVDLKRHFLNWILQIEISGPEKITLDKDSTFLTFNYTKTLEIVYLIESSKINYIHNRADDQDSHLVLGHGREFSEADSFSKNNDEDTDVRVAEGNNILDNYFRETYKDTDSIIREQDGFFSGLTHINEIYILGHSLSDVDIKYFETIKRHLSPDSIWTVSYYDNNEKIRHEETLRGIGLDDSKFVLVTLKDLE